MGVDSRALRIAIALALPFVTLIAAHVLGDPLYRTNDDPGMLLLASGQVFVDEPTPYLIFSNHLWGQLLASFYSWFPAFPWYRLFQLAVQLIAGGTLVYSALGRRITAGRLIPVAGCFVVFDMLMSMRPQFTLTSATAAIAAVILAAGHSNRASWGRARWVLFAGLWAAAAAIRHESAVLVFLLSLPATAVPLLTSWREGGARLAVRRVVLPLSVAAMILASLYGYNRVRYNVPEWRDFMATGSSIGAVLDFGAAGSAESQSWARFPDGTVQLQGTRYKPEVYAAAAEGPGWTRSDVQMLMEWFYADKDLFSLERVNSFLDSIGEPARSPAPWLDALRQDPQLPLMLLAIGLALSCRRLNRFDLIGLVLALGGALAALTFVDYRLHRLVSWVYEPVLAFLCWSVIVAGRERPLALAQRVGFVIRAVVAGILLSLLLATAGRFISESSVGGPRREALVEAVKQLKPGSEALYVSWASAFPLELLGPFDDLGPYRELRFYSVGADTRGGHNVRLLERLGIDDIHQAIYRDPRLRVISEQRHSAILIDFVEQRYSTPIAAQRVASYSTAAWPLFNVYRFSETPNDE
jgi:hypothetical protein